MSGNWREIKDACPACGHDGERRGSLCTVSADGKAILCRRRSEGGRPIPQRDGSTAWWFRVSDLIGSGPVAARPKKDEKKLTSSEVVALLKRLRTSVNPIRLSRLADRLNVSVPALEAYGIGWHSEQGLWSFPMYDGSRGSDDQPRPCGIRLRSDDGKVKVAVRGSSEGIFLPAGFIDNARPIPEAIDVSTTSVLSILLPEGPTDCAAAWDAGFRLAIGRPNNRGGSVQIARLLIGLPTQDLVVVGERESPKHRPDGAAYFPGIEGALELLDKLVCTDHRLRFLYPPEGAKDLRDWAPTASTADLLAAVYQAVPVTREWLKRAKNKYVEKCEKERRSPQRVA